MNRLIRRKETMKKPWCSTKIKTFFILPSFPLRPPPTPLIFLAYGHTINPTAFFFIPFLHIKCSQVWSRSLGPLPRKTTNLIVLLCCVVKHYHTGVSSSIFCLFALPEFSQINFKTLNFWTFVLMGQTQDWWLISSSREICYSVL